MNMTGASRTMRRNIANPYSVNMIPSCPEFKIFWSIICSIAILMMDRFPRLKITTKHLLHNKSMFGNATNCVSKWMVFYKSPRISIGINSLSTFPCWRIFELLMHETTMAHTRVVANFQMLTNIWNCDGSNSSAFYTSLVDKHTSSSFPVTFTSLCIPKEVITQMFRNFIHSEWSLFWHIIVSPFVLYYNIDTARVTTL